MQDTHRWSMPVAKTQTVRSKPALVASRAQTGSPASVAEMAGRAAPTAAFEPSALSRTLSDFEFAMFTLMFGFQAWTETCMAAADIRGLNSMDILVLHAVNHRARARRQTEICMVLNIEDQHLVAYALKKLIAAELVVSVAEGRERFFETTLKGDQACIAYRRVREEFLVPNLSWIAGSENAINDTSGFLRTMTALYAQAGRFATAATAGRPRSPPMHTKR
jgi:predicted MarR family transcription regulator